MTDADHALKPGAAPKLTRRRFVQRAAAAAALGAASAGVAYRWLRESVWPARGANLLLVTLDTTRADRCGCYGYAAAETPALDGLAKAGVLFENAYATVPETIPSHASMLTGLYPPENGVHSNIGGRLGTQVPTLAEVLGREGYDTAAFIAAVVLSARHGLNRGFATYDDDMAGGERHGDDTRLMRSGRLVADAALKWLDAPRKNPFFCWVHLFDPHAPYEAHAEVFGDRFADRPYDGDLAFADRQLGRIVEHLKSRGLFERTLIMVVGDHGEGFGEHQEQEHGFLLYNATVRVPLVIVPPDQLAEGRRVTTPVSLVDLFPTALDCLGVRSDARTSGRSLAGALRGSALEPRPCYSEATSAFLAFGWSRLKSVATESWKYVRSVREELYDLTTDPDELHNLADAQPARLEEMRQLLAGTEGAMSHGPESAAPPTERERRALRSLGYVSGGGATSPTSDDAPLPDVNEMIVHYNEELTARRLLRTGNVAAAIKKLERVIAAAPSFLPARLTLGAALQEQGKMDEAAAAYRAALEIRPESPEAHFDLAKLHASQGRTDAAVEHYTAAVEFDPSFAMAHLNLASLLFTRGDAQEARRHFELGLEAFPDSTVGQFNFGLFLASQGEVPAALSHLRRAAELSPRDPRISFQTGRILAGQGQWREAAAELERTLELNPAYPGAGELLERVRAGSFPR